MIKTINKVDRLTHEIALIGSLPILQTPETQGWLINFSNANQDDALDVINLMSKTFMQILKKKYKNIDDVAVIDGIEIWNQLKSPTFIDTIHPDAKTSSKLAKLFVSNASDQLSTFGF